MLVLGQANVCFEISYHQSVVHLCVYACKCYTVFVSVHCVVITGCVCACYWLWCVLLKVFERWMEWEPEEQAWNSYIKMELRYKELERARNIYERFVQVRRKRM